MSRVTKLLLGLMLAGIVFLHWLATRPATKHSSISTEPPVVVANKSVAPEDQTVSPTIVPAPAPETTTSLDAQLARVLNQLHDWDENDDSDSRPERLKQLAALLDGTNMLDLIQRLPPKFMGYAFAVPAVREKLLADPAATLTWMSAYTNVSSSQLSTFLQDWGQSAHDGMATYLAALPAGQWKQTVMATAAGQALSGDPVDAILYARQMDAGPQQTALLQMATTTWAGQNPDAASQWVAQIQDPALREQLLGSIAVGYADTDPAQALEFSLQSLPPGPVADQSSADIAWRWALQDPASAGNYLAQLPESNARKLALSGVLNVWANHDPAAAMDWIESLPAGSLQAQAAAAMLATLPATSP